MNVNDLCEGSTITPVAGTPPTVTVTVPSKSVPVRRTLVLPVMGPKLGDMPVIVGNGLYENKLDVTVPWEDDTILSCAGPVNDDAGVMNVKVVPFPPTL